MDDGNFLSLSENKYPNLSSWQPQSEMDTLMRNNGNLCNSDLSGKYLCAHIMTGE